MRPYLFYTISSSAEFTGTLDVSAQTSVKAGLQLDARSGHENLPLYVANMWRKSIFADTS